jgi:hypothetical protein
VGDYFQIFVAFPENLYFNARTLCYFGLDGTAIPKSEKKANSLCNKGVGRDNFLIHYMKNYE